MFILLVFLYMKSGMIEVRYSTVTTYKACQEALPLYERLYINGKFHDGPPAEDIKDIKSRCEKI